MINDKSIREQVKDIYDECNGYLAYVTNLNECAYSDRILESIIAKCNTLSLLHKNNDSEVLNERNFKDKYDYDIISFWNDSDDLYVNYEVIDRENNIKVNAIDYYNTSDIGCDYNSSTEENIKDHLLVLIKDNQGSEFNLPKISEVSPLLKYIYDCVCSNESNMSHIDNQDWENLKEEETFTDKDIETLKQEIKKYDIPEYITIDENEYKICGYGCLQCCFSDDSKDRGDELER